MPKTTSQEITDNDQVTNAIALADNIANYKKSFETALSSLFNAEVLAKLKESNKKGIYRKQDIDEQFPLIKTCKLILNLLTALEDLTRTYNNVEFNFTGVLKGIWRGDLNLHTIKSTWQVIADIREHCPKMFELVTQGVFAQLGQNADAGILSKICENIGFDLTANITDEAAASSVRTSYFDHVKNGLVWLQDIEKEGVAATKEKYASASAQSTKDNDVDVAAKAAAIEAIFNNISKSITEIASHEVITADIQDNLKINANNLNKVLDGLKNIYLQYQRWGQSNTLGVLTHVYENSRQILKAIWQLKSDENIHLLLSSTNQEINSVLANINSFMADLVIHMETFSANYGLNQEELFNGIEPVFIEFKDLLAVAKVEIDPPADVYPYWQSRIQAFTKETAQKQFALTNANNTVTILTNFSSALHELLDEVEPRYDADSLKNIMAGIDRLRKLNKLNEEDYQKLKAEIIPLQEKLAATVVPAPQIEAPSNQGWLSWLGGAALGLGKKAFEIINSADIYAESPLKNLNSTIKLTDILSKTLKDAEVEHDKLASQYQFYNHRLTELQEQQNNAAKANANNTFKITPITLLAAAHSLVEENKRVEKPAAEEPKPKNNLKDKAAQAIIDCKQQFLAAIEANLDPIEYARLKESSNTDFYPSNASDSPAIKVIKVILNILNSLERLANSFYDVMAYNNLRKSLQQIDSKTFNEVWLLLGNIYNDCPPIFAAVIEGTLAGVDSATNGFAAKPFIEKLFNSIYVSLQPDNQTSSTKTNPQSTQLLNQVKNGLVKLQKLEADKEEFLEKKYAKKSRQLVELSDLEPNEPTISGTQNSPVQELLKNVIKTITETIQNDPQYKVLTNNKGVYKIADAHDNPVNNLTQVLNVLQGLKQLHGHWSRWNDNNVITAVAKLYNDYKFITSSLKQLKTDENLQALAGKINQIIKPALAEMNGLMQEIACYIDSLEVDCSLKQGIILEKIEPMFHAYKELAVIAGVSFNPELDFPYLQARVENLAIKKQKNNFASVHLELATRTLKKVKQIYDANQFVPLNDFKIDDLNFIKKNLFLLALPETKQKAYEEALEQAIARHTQAAEKVSGLTDTLYNMAQTGINTLDNLANLYWPTSPHTAINEQLEQAMQNNADRQAQLTQQNHVVNIRFSSLSKSLITLSVPSPAKHSSNDQVENKKSTIDNISKRPRVNISNLRDLFISGLNTIKRVLHIGKSSVIELPHTDESISDYKEPELKNISEAKATVDEFTPLITEPKNKPSSSTAHVFDFMQQQHTSEQPDPEQKQEFDTNHTPKV